MKRTGKKGRAWINARNRLKKTFENLGIVRCEMCNSDFGLGFAHSKKRADIKTQSELEEVALLCNEPCHRQIERLSKSEMFNQITSIIAKRKTL